MKKILDYLGYFILALFFTIIIAGLVIAIAKAIIEWWFLVPLIVLIFVFLEVQDYCKKKNRSPWRIILNLKEKETPENSKDNI